MLTLFHSRGFCSASREKYHQEPKTTSKEAIAAIRINPINQSSREGKIEATIRVYPDSGEQYVM